MDCTCWSVKVVRLRRCLRRANDSSWISEVYGYGESVESKKENVLQKFIPWLFCNNEVRRCSAGAIMGLPLVPNSICEWFLDPRSRRMARRHIYPPPSLFPPVWWGCEAFTTPAGLESCNNVKYCTAFSLGGAGWTPFDSVSEWEMNSY